jgi:hypothetical protein
MNNNHSELKVTKGNTNNTLYINYLAHLPFGQDSSFKFGSALGCHHIEMTDRS